MEPEWTRWTLLVSRSVEFVRMWGETRIVYSCFLPDTEGGRWRAKERKEGEKEGGSAPLCDMHWCSCSSRSNTASVLCSSSSRLPSAPLNYSQPEDVRCGCLLLLLPPTSLLCLSVSHPFFFLMWRLVSEAANRSFYLQAGSPPGPTATHLSSNPPPFIADSIAHTFIPARPSAARLDLAASFFKGKTASC